MSFHMRWPLSVLLVVGCGSSSSDVGSGGSGGGVSGDPLASGLAISEISVNQAVKVPLVVAGTEVVDRAPVVAGRAGLVRVAVQPEPGFQPRPIVAELAIADAAGSLLSTEQRTLTVKGPSADADLASTFDFPLPAEAFTADTTFSVTLREAGPVAVGPASSGARFPDKDRAPLAAVDTGAALRMVLVPFRYDADGSGRMPDLSGEQIALYEKQILAMYPTRAVEFRIRDPIPWSVPVEPGGDGWAGILENLLFWRQKDRSSALAAPDEYYYGVFSPEPDFLTYCGGSPVCILGLSSGSEDPAEEYFRGSVGVGFTGEHAASTLAHETGHAHGRRHAPCAPGGFIQQVDPGYPYAEGAIGTWGWNPFTQELFDPAGPARDFMGYCEPTWISDYNYRALADRMTFVNAHADVVAPESSSHLVIFLDGAGQLALGHEVALSHPPAGEPRPVETLDGAGQPLRRIDGRFVPFDHLPGGLLLVRKPKPDEKALRLDGRTLHL
jgi:hypothetical protein